MELSGFIFVVGNQCDNRTIPEFRCLAEVDAMLFFVFKAFCMIKVELHD
jgi:hypothetical protein